MPDGARASLHASCVVVGEAGILVRGIAGCGKSTLSRRLVDDAALRGLYAAHVADDRVLLERCGGRLVARPHAAIAGLVETRGVGIGHVTAEAAAIVRLIVDLGEAAERLPAPQDTMASILDVTLARIRARAPEDAVERVRLALAPWRCR